MMSLVPHQYQSGMKACINSSTLLIFLVCLYLLHVKLASQLEEPIAVNCPNIETDLGNITVLTANGAVSYSNLLDTWYSKMGYELRSGHCPNPTAPLFFPLQHKNKLNCSRVFRDWTTIQNIYSESHSRDASPPRRIPELLLHGFTMDGLALLETRYKNEIPEKISAKLLKPWTENGMAFYYQNYEKEHFGFLPYGSDSAPVFYALKDFSPAGQRGLVIGSQSPWIEAMLLFFGAERIITSEYAPLGISHSQIHYIHPLNLSKSWRMYTNLDFVVSFSSIEHSGLGRYGDPLDPIGDLREIDKVSCLLKPGGVLYIGLPNGQDSVVFNLHRIYGDLRWPLIAAGFEVLGIYQRFHKFNSTQFARKSTKKIEHVLLVLRKL